MIQSGETPQLFTCSPTASTTDRRRCSRCESKPMPLTKRSHQLSSLSLPHSSATAVFPNEANSEELRCAIPATAPPRKKPNEANSDELRHAVSSAAQEPNEASGILRGPRRVFRLVTQCVSLERSQFWRSECGTRPHENEPSRTHGAPSYSGKNQPKPISKRCAAHFQPPPIPRKNQTNPTAIWMIHVDLAASSHRSAVSPNEANRPLAPFTAAKGATDGDGNQGTHRTG